MNEHQAMTAVARMYAAHGTTKPAEVVAALAEDVLLSTCGACAKEVLETARGGAKPLTVQTYRDSYRREFASPNHGLHVGVDERQVDVGKAEADWHTRGVRFLVDAGMAPDRAEVAAAMQWANAIPVATDADITVWSHHTPKRITPELAAAAWDYARACATREPADMSEDEWTRAVTPWRRAWTAAMA